MATYAYGAERRSEQPVNGGADEQPAQPGTPPEQLGTESAVAEGPRNDTQGSGGAIDPAAVREAKRAKAERLKQRAREKYYQRRDAARATKAARGDAAAAATTTTRKTAAQATLDLTHILYSLHTMGSVLLQIPSLVITQEEAKQLASAITRVSELYEIPILDEKARAWINLGLVGVQVYGTRIAAAMVERKKKAPTPPPMVITPFRPPQPQHRPPQQPIPPIYEDEAAAEAFAEEVNIGQA